MNGVPILHGTGDLIEMDHEQNHLYLALCCMHVAILDIMAFTMIMYWLPASLYRLHGQAVASIKLKRGINCGNTDS